jgi:hypothetical protein
VPGRILLALGVALCFGATGALGAGADGWHGKTSQGKKIELYLTPSGKLVDLVQARYVLDCSDESTQVRSIGLSRKAGDTLVVDDDGHFGITGTVASGLPGKGSGSVTYRLRGRTRDTKTTGSFSIDYALDSGVTCSSGKVTYVLR